MTVAIPFRNSNIFEILQARYFHESFRPVYPILSFFAFGYSENTELYPYSVYVVYSMIWIFFVYVLYRLLEEIFLTEQQARENKFLRVCLAQLLFVALYFLTTSKVEIFGFMSVAFIHMVPVIFILFAVLLLIKKQQRKTDYAFLFISAFFVAGGSNQLGGMTLAMAGGVALLARINKHNLFSQKATRSKLIFFCSVLSVFFILFVTNPGMQKHYEYEQAFVAEYNHSFYHKTWGTLKNFFSVWKLLGAFILIITLQAFSGGHENIRIPKIKLSYFFISCMLAVGASAATCWLAYSELMTGRVWFAADVSIFVLLCAIVLKNHAKLVWANKMLAGGMISLSLVLLVFDGLHIPRLLHFSQVFDKTISGLQQEEANQVIELPPFPDSDLSSQAYFSDDPDFPTNLQFCEFYHIKARIAVKK